jgi:poly-gamma-glutamate capsule biosynthesis protein CapA/YwtB (metallophosphatase superfamily)
MKSFGIILQVFNIFAMREVLRKVRIDGMFGVVIKYRALKFNLFLASVMFFVGFGIAFITEPAFYLRGQIVVGCTGETYDLTCEIADAFQKCHPFVNVIVKILQHDRIEQAVFEREVNIAVVSGFSVAQDRKVEYVYIGKKSFLFGAGFFTPVSQLDYESIRDIFENTVTDWSELGYYYGSIRIVSFLSESSNQLFARIFELSQRGFGVLQENSFQKDLWFADIGEYLTEDFAPFYILSLEDLSAEIRPIIVNVRESDLNRAFINRYLLEVPIYCVGKKQIPYSFAGWYQGLFQKVFLNFTEKYLAGFSMDWEDMVDLCAVGDVMLDRGVKEGVKDRGYQCLFEETKHILSKADIVFCNLECPITREGRQLNMFRADPDIALKVLKDGSVDIVSIANNHILDFDDVGLLWTLDNLSKAGISHVGAGGNLEESRREVVFKVKGNRIAFLAYTETWFMWTNNDRKWEAGDATPGVMPASMEYLLEDINRVRKDVDLIIVSVHWGKEYVDAPTEFQYEFARTAIDAGANIVLGHHPHVLQGIEFYNDGIICYSLGNFIFDLKRLSTKETGIFKFQIWNGTVIGLEFIPCYIQDCTPVPALGELQKQIWERLRRNSRLIYIGRKR